MSAVWVVDDDQSIRWVLEKALGREGFDVRRFARPPQALGSDEQGERRVPSVVLAGQRKPQARGIEGKRLAGDRPDAPPVAGGFASRGLSS